MRIYLDACCANRLTDDQSQPRICRKAEAKRGQRQSLNRASELEFCSYGAFDALHFACAEIGHADILFTTDDKFIRANPQR